MTDPKITGTTPPTYDNLGLGVPEAKTNSGSDLGQTEFFELMVAQITNQDPLKPLDSTEFLSQVAQLSTVSGVQSIDRSIQELSGSLGSAQALQASTLVGSRVMVDDNRGELTDARRMRGGVDIESTVSGVEILIESPGGELVRRMTMGPQGPGIKHFEWDGKADDGSPAPLGNYTVRASVAAAGELAAVPVVTEARVGSVTIGRNGAGVTLNLDGKGAITIDQVREFL